MLSLLPIEEFTHNVLIVGESKNDKSVLLRRVLKESATVSRRALSLFSILLVSIFTIVGFIIALKFYEDVKYPLASFIFLAIIGSYINLVGWLIGVRPILIADTFEIGKEATGWQHAPIGIAIIMCLWDGVIEISGIYFGFYMITTYFWAKDDLNIKFRE